MGHAAHFLRRLDRVSDGQVELALTLYRDEELLREVLSRAELPDGAERLAISLADPVEGPFVVVTRAGRFVTCLGEGMRASELPVVTRERLDAAAARVTRMRDELERVRALRESGAEGQAALAFKRMQQQGPRFAREDARTLLDALPLIEGHCLDQLLAIHSGSEEHIERLARLRLDVPRRLRSVEQEYLLAFGDSIWATAHLIVLASSDKIRRTLARTDERTGGRQNTAHLVANSTFDWGTSLHVTRALWFLARGGKRALAAVKAHDARYSLAQRLYRELGLGAIALGSEKLRAEAVKALAPDARPETDATERLAGAAAGALRDVVAQPAEHEQSYLLLSRTFAAGVATGKRDGELPTPEEIAGIPEDVARIAWISHSASLHHDRAFSMFVHMFSGLPWIVRASAEELFMPAEWAKRIVPARTLDEVAYWVRAYIRANHLGPSRTPQRTGAKVGRNDPCACGSGKKYKRCCGAA